MGLAHGDRRLAGIALGDRRLAGIALGDQLVWRADAGPVYTPLYSTDWSEYSAGVDITNAGGWGPGHSTVSSRVIQTYSAGGAHGIIASGSSTGVSSDRAIRENELPAREKTWVRAVFTELRSNSTAQHGVLYHAESGTGTQHTAWIRGDDATLHWGTVSGINQASAVGGGISLAGEGLSLPYTVEARAVSSTSVQIWVNNTHLGTHTTAGSGRHCGLMMQRTAGDAKCTELTIGEL